MQSDQQPNPVPQHKLKSRLMAAGAAAALVLVGLGAFSLLPKAGPQNVSASTPHLIPVAEQARPTSESPHMLEGGAPFSFADLVERVSPAVVTVTVEEQVADNDGDDQDALPDNLPAPFRDFFNQFGNRGQQAQRPRKAIAMGSGFIIDKAGYLVTNNHVIDHSKKITVKLPDGREFTARLIGADAATDIALLKINSDKPLPTVEFGDDRRLRVGDWVVAVGNPFGLSNTVTAGIVSSIGRDIGNGPYTDFIQIDAPINRGNSGGPTFDIHGQVVGMNSMIFSPSGGSVGIGFAIPASTIHQVVAQLQAHGHVSRGWLGVQIQSITPEIAASLGMQQPKGAIVATVVPGGPAAKGGFQPGDIVIAINGKAIDGSRDLTRDVAAIPAGTQAAFSVNRGGKAQTLHVKIGQRDEKVAAVVPSTGDASTARPAQAMGMGLASVTPDTRRLYNLDDSVKGVVVTRVDPNSDAADKGIQPGDIVVSVGNQSVRSPQDVQGRVAGARASGKKSVLLLVTGANGQRFVPLTFG
ncbi:MAG TPA: Do family serine endopeptidase [Rhizomicrobium sp.]|nr:Do family serine endopeptidase [Rhizomicrobium sp.]